MSGMSLWKASILKQRGDEQWANVYTLSAGSLAAAISAGLGIVPIEKAVHLTSVFFISLTVEPAILGAGGGTVTALSGTGAVGVSSTELPLFNTVRVWFRPASGKPSQKYLRLPLRQNDMSGQDVHATTRAFVQANYADVLLGIAAFVDVDGQAFTSSGVAPRIQERQLRRKRRAREGFKRGWVPA